MPLESLENQINIHDLTLEQEKTPKPEWQKRYEDFKKTPAYDSNYKQWNEWWSTDNNSIRADRVSIIQLGAIAVEARFNPAEARNQLNHLRNSNFYNKEKKDWNDTLFANQEVRLGPFVPDSKFLECYNEFILGNQEKAEDLYKLCEPEIISLSEALDRKIAIYDSGPHTRESLISVIVEAKFNKERAYQHFQKLKKSGLYDETSNLWNAQLGWRKGDDTKHICNQLLGVLAEAQFDKAKAQNDFKILKNSPFYNPDSRLWSDCDVFEPLVEFTSILCEQEFEEPRSNTSTNTPSFPETRKY